MTIFIKSDAAAKCWLATFRGGHMPQNQPLPLPFSPSASAHDVADSLKRRFRDASVIVVPS
jgi:hypothetical protein